METENIISITTEINGVKNYVTTFASRFNGTLLPHLDKDPQLAHDYETIDQANDLVKKIHNTHHRVFLVEPITIPVTVKTRTANHMLDVFSKDADLE